MIQSRLFLDGFFEFLPSIKPYDPLPSEKQKRKHVSIHALCCSPILLRSSFTMNNNDMNNDVTNPEDDRFENLSLRSSFTMNNNNMNINVMNPEDDRFENLSLRSSFTMNNNNMNINVMNPEDDRVENNLSLRLRPPSPPPQPPAPPSPTPLAQPHPVYSPPMEFLYSNDPLYVTPELDLLPSSLPTMYPTVNLNVEINNEPPPPPLYVTPELDLIPSSRPTMYPTMNLNVEINNEPPPPPLGQGRPPQNPRNNGEDHQNRNIELPYAWTTDRPAYVHDKSHLEKNFIYTVTGTVRCNKCGKEYSVVFNIEEKLKQFESFVESKKRTMHNRAPPEWTSPQSLVCEHCTGDGVRPVIDVRKDDINWLFLFLGQMLGYCTLEQLKYFCACTQNHRTGSKDRVLYDTYREIFKQLRPDLPHQDPW
ncbi:hypothetical protein K1719_005041 [Acacia pycnantha]|nr:hypothetical protein K1719_005041 [Acacia pycnantha]